MTSRVYIICVCFSAVLSCSKKENEPAGLPVDYNKGVPSRITVTDPLTVNITEKISLKWNAGNNSFVKDEDYYKYVTDKNAIQAIANSTASTKDLHVKICTKNTANLKVGDIAFLYLLENHHFHLFDCLNMQFDTIDSQCNLPNNLLDYLEENRKEVSSKIKQCISP